MPTISFDLAVMLQPFANGMFLDEALSFPEIASFDDDPDRLHRTIKKLVARTVENIPPAEHHRRRLPGTAVAGFVDVTLAPVVHAPAWKEPIVLRFRVVRWSHPAPAPPDAVAPGSRKKAVGHEAEASVEAFVAHVPALGIDVIAPRPDVLEDRLVEDIRTALMRTKQAASLERLVWFDQYRDIELVSLSCEVEVKSPKQLAREEADRREQPVSVLAQVGVDLANERLQPAYERDAVIARLVETLTGPEPRSVLLIGPSGVGKTAAVHEMVCRRASLGLASTPFWATSGARLVAGMSGFGMWQDRAAKLWREASRQRAILHLGNLLELMDVGKSEHQTQGIASFLRPYLARGDLLTIAECTPEQLPIIERQEPHLLAVFTPIEVAEPTPDEGVKILTRYAEALHPESSAGLSADGLAKLDLLHRRYATYSAYPGRPLRFLRNLLTDRASAAGAAGAPLHAGDVTRAFSRETGLPMCLLDETERLDLGATRDWFANRVIGQAEPVDLVVDLLATVKAGLARPRKPIASLLFIGPTGVGKTEMAKALAEFLFGSKDRLTRFDMSEYADPQAVHRLVGGSTHGEGHLTARIREQPFSVVLFDEIEKAHPQFFDLLLQMLGEGRLTDAAGRVADFCNAVVIMTSNLGAESFQQGGLGIVQASVGAERSREHFLRAVQDFFRPELFNRIDRVVPFAPLDEATILGIAHRQLDLVRQRDGIRHRAVDLDLETHVAAWLAQRGYDPRYGARPLKRAIDRELLAPMADELNGYHADTPMRLSVAVDGNTMHAQGKATGAHKDRAAGEDADLVADCIALRRDLQKLYRCSAGREMDNEIHRLETIEKRTRRGKYVNPEEARRLGELADWREIHAGFHALQGDVCAAEDAGLCAFLSAEPAPSTADRSTADVALTWERMRAFRSDWDRWMLALYLNRYDDAEHVIVAIFSEQPQFLMLLSQAYHRLATDQKGRVETWQFLPASKGRGKATPAPLNRRLVVSANSFWEQSSAIRVRPWDHRTKRFLAEETAARPLEGVVGLALVIDAPAALPRFIGETGLHSFRTPKQNGHCLVDASASAWRDYQAPGDMDRRGAIGRQQRRRSYDFIHGTLEDPRLDEKLPVDDKELHVGLGAALERALQQQVRAMLKE